MSLNVHHLHNDTQDTVPPELWRYLSSSVKKSSGLLKRLIRVSEIWMFEYKNFATFQSRAKILVMDYIKRSALKVVGVSS